MQQLRRSIDHSSICHSDGLQPKADAEDWQSTRLGPDNLNAYPCLFRCSGARREQDAVKGLREIWIVKARVVIAPDIDLGSNLRQVLNQVVDERVVVIDDEDFYSWHVIILTSFQQRRRLLSPSAGDGDIRLGVRQFGRALMSRKVDLGLGLLAEDQAVGLHVLLINLDWFGLGE